MFHHTCTKLSLSLRDIKEDTLRVYEWRTKIVENLGHYISKKPSCAMMSSDLQFLHNTEFWKLYTNTAYFGHNRKKTLPKIWHC